MSQQQLIRCYATQQAFHWFITGMLIPVLILIFQSRELSLTDIGLVMAVWIGTTTLLEIPLGSAADRFGRRKTYLLSLLLSMLGVLALLFASTISSVLASAILLGAARAVYSGTLDAWFYDAYQLSAGPLSYHDALARINLMITVGLALGSLVGGGLPDVALHHHQWFESKYDLNLILIVAATGVLFMVTVTLIPSEAPPLTQQKPSQQQSLLSTCIQALNEAFRHDVLKRVMQTTLVFGMVLSSVENFWQPYLANIMSDDTASTLIYGVISALYFLMAAAASWCSVKVLRWFCGSHRMLLLASRLSAGVVLLLVATTTQVTSFSLAYLVFFFLFTLGENSQMVLVNDNTKVEFRSTMLSISSFVVTCGGMIASLGFGYLSDHFGISASWSVVALLLVVSSFGFIRIPAQMSRTNGVVESGR